MTDTGEELAPKTSREKLEELFPQLLEAVADQAAAGGNDPALTIAYAAVSPMLELKARQWLETHDAAQIDQLLERGILLLNSLRSDLATPLVQIALVAAGLELELELELEHQADELAGDELAGDELEADA